jgi:hypothetical protein
MKYLTLSNHPCSSSTSSWSDVGDQPGYANLPCLFLPFPANPGFYGREDVLSQISEKLESTDGKVDDIKSVALWSTAGMGKTQIALEYANRQRTNGLKVVLWVATEDESESIKAFTEIASLLQLTGATDAKGHDQNRLLVLQLLQTACMFLLVRCLFSQHQQRVCVSD